MNKVWSYSKNQKRLLTAFFSVVSSVVLGQISLPNSTPVTENFDGMGTGTTIPANWKIQQSGSPTYAGGGTTVTQIAQTGAPTTGGTYNWGANSSTERALGVMTSGSFAAPVSAMAWYRNTNTSTLTDLTISYDLERYRLNSKAAQVDFYYSTDGSSWTAVSAGNIAAATIGTGANTYFWSPPATFNPATNPFTITGLSIPVNGDIYLRWNLNTNGSNSQGIGIDNVSVTASFSAPCSPPSAPTTESTSLTFPAVGCDAITINWTSGNGSDRIIIARQGSAVTAVPSNSTTYSANAVFGSGSAISAGQFVVYNGSGSGVTVTGLSSSTTYYFTIYEYNGSAGCESYYTSGTELNGNETTTVCSVCPHMTGALINSCDGSCSEGNNEILFFNSGDYSIPVNPSNIAISYGSSSPASTNYTNSFATNASYINTLNTSAACGTLFIDASAAGTIPANAVFMVMDDNPCFTYDFTSFCGAGPVYVLFSSDSDWSPGGNFVNGGSAGVLRYFRADFSGLVSGCVTDYSYEPNQLVGSDGAAISFPLAGGPANQYFNNGCSPPTTVLPVEALFFNATEENNLISLNWTTQSETNNDYFEIQKSYNGVNYSAVAKIKAAGNTIYPQYYSLTDDAPVDGNIYYRLKQVDYDGKFVFSNVAVINRVSKTGMVFYPNPAKEEIWLSAGKPGVIQIISLTGQILMEQKIPAASNYQINIQELPAGMYMMVFRDDFYYRSFTLVKL